MTPAWKVKVLLHEIGHGYAALLNGCPSVVIARDDKAVDGMFTAGRWREDEPPTREARLRVIIGGIMFMDGVNADEDVAGLAEYSEAEIEAAKAWCRDHVVPEVNDIDVVELLKMVEAIEVNGAIEVKRDPRAIH